MNFKNKSHQRGTLSLSLFFLINLWSCQEIPEADFVNEGLEVAHFVAKDPVYEEKLKELSLFMGEVFKDQNARKELFELAKIEGNQNEVEYNLRKLFDKQDNPLNQKKSDIQEAFYRVASKRTNSTTNQITNVEEFVNFIKENDIGVIAPYLAENFDSENLSSLTVSWWTQEFEDWNLNKDQEC